MPVLPATAAPHHALQSSSRREAAVVLSRSAVAAEEKRQALVPRGMAHCVRADLPAATGRGTRAERGYPRIPGTVAQCFPSGLPLGRVNPSVGLHGSGWRNPSAEGCCRPQRPRISRLCVTACASEGSNGSGLSSPGSTSAGQGLSLSKGDAVVVVEEPPFVKTAEPMPMLRRNDGIIQKGDVGRVLDSRPKDVWAVRLGTGAFLLDGKYIQPIQ